MTRIEVAGATDRGTVRRENQDAWRTWVSGDGGRAVLLVADGMGGHADGGLVAWLAVDRAESTLAGAADPGAALGEAVEAADAAVAGHREAHGGRMAGTTLVAAVVDTGGAVGIANVGDSRAYRIGAGVAVQLTLDHSLAAEEARAGNPRAAGLNRNVVTRAITGERAAPDLFETALAPGEVLALCSDGVWDALDDATLARLLGGAAGLAEAVTAACDAAIAAGSTDNVTVVAARLLPD
jgi:PPM family protein phosphatase